MTHNPIFACRPYRYCVTEPKMPSPTGQDNCRRPDKIVDVEHWSYLRGRKFSGARMLRYPHGKQPFMDI